MEARLTYKLKMFLYKSPMKILNTRNVAMVLNIQV